MSLHIKLNRYYLLLLLTTFILWFSVRSNAQGQSLLWKISGNHLQQPSYLLGTMHLLCAEDFEIKPKILRVVKEIHTIIFEADIDNIEGSEQLIELMKPIPDVLKNISPEQRTRLDTLLRQNQLTLEALNQFSPFGLMSLLTVKSFNCANSSNIKMMEQELYTLAKEQSLQLDHLETVDFQIKMIRSMNTVNDLLESLELAKDSSQSIKRLIKVYQAEDLNQLTALMNDPQFMSTLQQSKLLKERNRNWALQLPEKIKDQPTLIAVGAGHLGGRDGLISLLKQKGYSVTPVFN